MPPPQLAYLFRHWILRPGRNWFAFPMEPDQCWASKPSAPSRRAVRSWRRRQALYGPEGCGRLPLLVMAHVFSAPRELRLDPYAAASTVSVDAEMRPPAGSDSQRSTADALKLLLNRACDRRRRVSCAGPGSERVAAEARPPQTPRRRGSAPLRAEMRVATLGLNRSVHHPCRAHRFILSGRCRAKAVGRSEISARARSCGGGRSVR
jgi:hypothetical protein